MFRIIAGQSCKISLLSKHGKQRSQILCTCIAFFVLYKIVKYFIFSSVFWMLYVSSIWALISSLFFSLFSHWHSDKLRCGKLFCRWFRVTDHDMGVLFVNTCYQSVKICMLWPAEEPKYSPASHTVVESDGEVWATWLFSGSWKRAVSGFCKTDMYEDFYIVMMKFYLK